MVDKNNFLNELRNHNPLALNYVLKEYGNLIYRLAYKYTNSLDICEECVNDVLLKIWNCIDNYKYGIDEFKSWIATITKYTSIDLLRSEKKHFSQSPIENVTLSSKENIEENQISKNELTILKKYINELQDLDRDIINDRFFKNENIPAIAAKYNLTTNAVTIRIMRISKKLKAYMNNLEV